MGGMPGAYDEGLTDAIIRGRGGKSGDGPLQPPPPLIYLPI